MADTTDRVTFVFEAKGGEDTSRKIRGIAGALGATQKEADKAAKDVRELKQYLEFSKGIKSTKDLEAALKKHPSLANKIEGAYRRLREKEVKGLTGAFKNLTAEEKRQLVTMRNLNAEVKRSHGITNSFKNAMTGAVPALGMMATGVGAATLIFQKIIRVVDQAIQKVEEFIKSSIKLGAEQEQGRTTMIALIGDIEAGTAAYDKFDKRVTESPFKREIYNLEEYAAAVGVGMGNAYLDAAEAGDRYNFSAKSFVENMYKMERGLLRSVNTLGQFSVVMEKAGLDVEDIKNGTISYAEATDMMREAVHELAEEQNKMAGTTGAGTLNLIRNYWNDIKEDIGEALIKYLKPMGIHLFNMLKDIRSMKDLWIVAGAVLKGIAPVIGTGILVPLKGIVTFMRSFNYLAERTAAAWRTIAAAMGRAVPEEGPKTVKIGEYMATHDRPVYTPTGLDKEKFIFGDKYWEEKYKETGIGTTTPKKKLPTIEDIRRKERVKEFAALPIYPETAPSEEEARERARAIVQFRGTKQRREEAELQKKQDEARLKTAEKWGRTSGDAFQAVLEGNLPGFFKNLGLTLANQFITAVASAGIFKALGGGGGFWSIARSFLPFEQEGAFTHITKPMPIIIHPGESVFNQDTIASLRAGGMPRGGRPGFEYGPETYGGAAPPAPNVYVNVNPGVNADYEIHLAAERGRAIAEGING